MASWPKTTFLSDSILRFTILNTLFIWDFIHLLNPSALLFLMASFEGSGQAH
jgi:hypothetical protein